MAALCEHVARNETLNFDDDEVKDIVKAVDILVNRFVDAWQKKRTDFIVNKLRLCGSMAEKTRIKVPWDVEDHFEFDYLVELETSPGSGAMWAVHAGACTGCVFIERDIVDADSVKGATDFISNSFSEVFLKDFFSAIQKMCNKNLCCRMIPREDIGMHGDTGMYSITGIHDCIGKHDEYERSPFQHGCKFCTVHMQTGRLIFNSRVPSSNTAIGKLSFDWTASKVHDKVFQYIENGKNREVPMSLSVKNTSIRVDFHPVFVLNYDSRKGSVYSLFPKRCTRHEKQDCSSLTWRLSTQEIETKLIQEASQEHKLAFMTMKYVASSPYKHSEQLCKGANIFGRVKQYFLKNIFLSHLHVCGQKPVLAANCVCDMFGELSKCYLENNLPQFELKYNLLEIISESHNTKHQTSVLGHVMNTTRELLIRHSDDSDLSDFRRDLKTITTIVKSWETKRKTEKIATETSSVLKDFLQFRRENSSLEAMEHFVLKCLPFFPNYQTQDMQHDEFADSVPKLNTVDKEKLLAGFCEWVMIVVIDKRCDYFE